ncbi:MAG: hypothetical protein JM58_07455 [Peptococcaceae bacterium BICA1-8]|nr:MAG: hypothetical protein JM58_07455 [Peptococcaceae bacterium BICA1-8]
MRNKNIVTSLVLLAFSAYAWYEVHDLPLISNFFPKVCVFFLAFLSLMLLAQSLLSKNIPAVAEEKKNLRFVKTLTAGIAGYVIAIFIIGFNLGSIIFLSIFGYFFDPVKSKKGLMQSIIIAFLATSVFYVVFGIVFNVPLPEGMIFEALR